MRRAVLLGLALSLAPAVPAPARAGDDALVGDRPDFTESAVTVGRGRVQVEAGATVVEATDLRALSAGEALVRVGLGERWELRLGVGSWTTAEVPGEDPSGFEDPSIGAKLSLRDPAEGGTALALLFGSTLAAGSDDLTAGDEQPEVKLLAGRPLGGRVELGANVGYGRPVDGGRRFDQVSASLTAAFGVSDRLGAFVEVYGFSREAPGGPESTYFDGGVTFALGPDLQLDARAGTGLSGNDVDLFLGAGVVRRW